MCGVAQKVRFLLILSWLRISGSLTIPPTTSQLGVRQSAFSAMDLKIVVRKPSSRLWDGMGVSGSSSLDTIASPDIIVPATDALPVGSFNAVGSDQPSVPTAAWNDSSDPSLTAENICRLSSSTSDSTVDSRAEPRLAIDPEDEPSINTIPTAAGVSRRDAFRQGFWILFGGAVATEVVLKGPRLYKMGSSQSILLVTEVAKSFAPSNLEPVDVAQVVAETKINVTVQSQNGFVTVDDKHFTKVQTKKVPWWLPEFLAPPPTVIQEISNAELLVAATIAGSATSFARDALLYPLATIKTRIQADRRRSSKTPIKFQDKAMNLGRNVQRHVQAGDLYAGITPTLLVSVPATGVYFGVRDVTKRFLGMAPFLNDVEIVLLAAFCADVISLCFRTPADTLVARLQDRQRNVGDWVGDSLKRLPGIIITDLPYLLSKIYLGRQFIHGSLCIDRYAEFAMMSAIIAAFLTTPFDVARTRILVDSDGDPTNGIDGGSGKGLINTMISISKEGEGGVSNLFAGWLERVLYLGVGRAWLEPLQLIAYIGIRDTVLLEWF